VPWRGGGGRGGGGGGGGPPQSESRPLRDCLQWDCVRDSATQQRDRWDFVYKVTLLGLHMTDDNSRIEQKDY
jgi:hypothetical protein